MDNRLIGTILGVTVAIIVIAACLAPTLADAQKNIGAEEIISNSHTSVYTLDVCPSSTVIEIGPVDGDLKMTVNGEVVDILASANVPLIISDAVSGNPNSNGTLVSLSTIDGQTVSATASKPATITLDNGEISVVFDGDEIYSGACTWMYAPSNDGPYWPTGSSSIYVRSIDDVIFAGATSSIWWSFHNGKFVGTEGYTFKASYDIELVDGTTDIYEISSFSAIATLDGVDTTLTPSRVVAPADIVGHEHSSAGDLIGVIPVLVLVAVLGSIVAVVVKKP